jgi:hypothetical protein
MAKRSAERRALVSAVGRCMLQNRLWLVNIPHLSEHLHSLQSPSSLQWYMTLPNWGKPPRESRIQEHRACQVHCNTGTLLTFVPSCCDVIRAARLLLMNILVAQ